MGKLNITAEILYSVIYFKLLLHCLF